MRETVMADTGRSYLSSIKPVADLRRNDGNCRVENLLAAVHYYEYSIQAKITDAERPRGSKSRRSPQGMAVALFKDCNAGLDPLGCSLWASRDRASCECSQPEERAVALGCKRPGTIRKAAARGVAPLGKG